MEQLSLYVMSGPGLFYRLPLPLQPCHPQSRLRYAAAGTPSAKGVENSPAVVRVAVAERLREHTQRRQEQQEMVKGVVEALRGYHD